MNSPELDCPPQQRTRPDYGERLRLGVIGPILLGPARPALILTSSVTARGVVNMTAVAAVEAQAQAARGG